MAPLGPIPQQLLGDIALLTPAPSPFALCSQLPNTQVMLLLHRLPHLQTLHVVGHAADSTFDRFLTEYFVGLPPPVFPPAFQSLRELSFTSPYITGGINCVSLLILLSLPCIRCIDVYLFDETDNPPDPASAPTSTVTDLRIAPGMVPPLFLSGLLRIPQALISFAFRGTTGYDVSFNPRAFKNELQAHRDSLEFLFLDFDFEEECTEDDETEETDGRARPMVGSLRDWPRLRSLTCGLSALLGKLFRTDTLRLVDVVPSGLRVLEVVLDSSYPCERTLGEVLGLLERKEEVVPELQRLGVALEDEEQFETLRMACEAAGVTLAENRIW